MADPAAVREWIESGAVEGVTLGSWSTRRDEDAYLDTDDRAIAVAGFGARLRRRGSRITLTLKSLARLSDATDEEELGSVALHRRIELEGPAGGSTDPSSWPPSDARERLLAIVDGAPLRLRFILQQTRAVRELRGEADERAELSLDETTVLYRDTPIGTFSTLEIEALDGSAGLLARMAAALEATGLVVPEARSKEAIASGMLEQCTWTVRPRRTAMPVPGPRSSSSRAVPRSRSRPRRASWNPPCRACAAADTGRSQRGHPRRCRTQGAAHAPAADAGQRGRHPFGRGRRGSAQDACRHPAHARRVARLRRCLQARPAAALRARAARRGRDARVRARPGRPAGGSRGVHRDAARGRRAGDAAPGDEWTRQRDDARDTLLALLDSKAYSHFVAEYMDFTATPGAGELDLVPGTPILVRDRAAGRIWQAYETVRAHDTTLAWADVPALHALRIDGKRLRYTLEFFREVLPSSADLLVAGENP